MPFQRIFHSAWWPGCRSYLTQSPNTMITSKNVRRRSSRLKSRFNIRYSRAFLACLLAIACAFAARAEHTRRWRISTYEEFLKGKANGVAVRSDGRLELAPKFTLIADADAS